MMCRVVGVADRRADVHAETLGVAMQLTNFLRDIAEDWRRGRVYLEDLERFGYDEEDLERCRGRAVRRANAVRDPAHAKTVQARRRGDGLHPARAKVPGDASRANSPLFWTESRLRATTSSRDGPRPPGSGRSGSRPRAPCGTRGDPRRSSSHPPGRRCIRALRDVIAAQTDAGRPAALIESGGGRAPRSRGNRPSESEAAGANSRGGDSER